MSIEAKIFRLHLRPQAASLGETAEPGSGSAEQEESGEDDESAAGLEPEGDAGPLRRVASCAAAVAAMDGEAAAGTARARRRRGHRRVQFADEMGLELARVRLLREPQGVAPVLPPHVLARHCADSASDSSDAEQSEISGSSNRGKKFACQFAQPSSKYILFRETLERCRVSLCELHFCGATAQGSVSVKNDCFHKRVFVRVTFNAWRTFQDVEAVHCGSEDGGAQDNFSFSFHCPTLTAFEFCVCFEADGGRQAFWDNHGDENYKVSVTRSRKPAAASCQFTRDFKPSFRHVTQFSKYAAWEQHGSRVYY